MCGLVGIAGSINQKEDRLFKQMLYTDGLRGDHSTGVLFVPIHEKSPVVVRKAAVAPTEFLRRLDVSAPMSKKNIVLLGHNRYATVGKIEDENAHPFSFNKIVGAHNGTLTNKYALEDSSKFTVDSANLYHSIDKIGLEDTYDIIKGAWALSWWNLEEGKLNFLRNHQRPLCYCFSTDRKTMYWASEEGMLEFLLDRNKVKHTPIVITKPHHLYSFSIPRNGGIITDITITDMTPAPKVNYFPKQQASQSKFSEYVNKYSKQRREVVLGKLLKNNYNQDYFEGEFLEPPYEAIKLFVPPSRAMLKELYSPGQILIGNCTHYSNDDDVYFISPHGLEEVEVEEVEVHVGFNMEPLTFKQFKERTSGGCGWCGSPVMFEEDDVCWLNNREFLCPCCADNPDTQEFRNDI